MKSFITLLVALLAFSHIHFVNSSCGIDVRLNLRTTFISTQGNNYLYDVCWRNNGTQTANYEWYFVVVGDPAIEIEVRDIWNLVLYGSGDASRTHETFGPTSEYSQTYSIAPGESYNGGGFVINTPLSLVSVNNVNCS
eukprot:TRINITY_DN4621_c0_g2_i1.p1 TRINITY_DN4621_c0_g2~~TRINITY_DN4621_c0_g2_i1.p1  ORF type:complete len:138 (-),score=17.32 TRINITY_DN4621_c0_g2_i1:99-512(-)